MHQTMRWFGPGDPVSLADIRQAGCEGVVTALHHIPVGEVWTTGEIQKRKEEVEAAGMTWTVIESMPVSEAIKTQSGDFLRHIENYKTSLRNVAACGLKVVTYNFMPILDWVRTDIAYPMPDGSRALYFERNAWMAFDLYLLKRPGAANEYNPEDIRKGTARFEQMSAEEADTISRNILLGLPGSEERFTREQLLQQLKTYAGMDAAVLRQHLFYFLREVVPVAEAEGLAMAIHPDDPPFPVLGLPRIISTEQDVDLLLREVPSQANGLCFCTGSFGSRPDNDVVHMLKRFGDRVFFLHLRNTRGDAEGNFYESAHLDGDTDMYAVITEVAAIARRRNAAIPMRPDHGHQMLDDLRKKTLPGYSAIGRLRGLAELRGVAYAVSRLTGG